MSPALQMDYLPPEGKPHSNPTKPEVGVKIQKGRWELVFIEHRPLAKPLTLQDHLQGNPTHFPDGKPEAQKN